MGSKSRNKKKCFLHYFAFFELVLQRWKSYFHKTHNTHAHRHTMNPLMFIDTMFTVRYECWETWSSTFSTFSIYENFEVQEREQKKKAWKYTAHHHYHNSYFLGKTKINVENNSGGPNVNICKIQTESTVWNTLQLIWNEKNMLTVWNKAHIATSRSLLSCGIDWSKQKLNRIHILQT